MRYCRKLYHKKCLKKKSFTILQSCYGIWRFLHKNKNSRALTESDMCVCDIAVLLNMTHSAKSHQLRVLKQARLVKYRKEGKIGFYSLDDNHVKQIFDQGI